MEYTIDNIEGLTIDMNMGSGIRYKIVSAQKWEGADHGGTVEYVRMGESSNNVHHSKYLRFVLRKLNTGGYTVVGKGNKSGRKRSKIINSYEIY